MSIEQNRSPNWTYLLIENAMFRDKNFYHGLSSKAQLLFLYLRSAHNPANPDTINLATGKTQVKLAYSFISKIQGFHSFETIHRSFQELIAKGWIEVTEQGGKYGGQNAYAFPNQYGDFRNGKKKSHKKKK